MTRPSPITLLRLGISLAASLPAAAHAQMHHVDAPEHVTRAVGVYEWIGDLAKPTAARFVPVSLFINGHFEDAGLYLARPVPLALEPGDVYALEHAGEPEGLLDLDFARRVVTGKALADDDPEGAWYAYGRFTPEAAPKAPLLHASRHLPVLHASAGPNTPPGTKVSGSAADKEDSRPHMTRRDGGAPASAPASPPSPPSQTGGSGTGSGNQDSAAKGGTTGTTSTTADDSDDIDRPTLRRRDPSQDARRRREYGSKSNTSGVTAAGPALGDDPDRPILGRSKTEAASTPELTGLPADMQQAVAVSDAKHNDAHPFAREWASPAERADMLTAMEGLAKPHVAAYLAANDLVASSDPLPAVMTGHATAPSLSSTRASATTSGAEGSGPPKLQRGVPQEYKRSATPAGGALSHSQQASQSAGQGATPVLRNATASHGSARAASRKHARAATSPPAPLTLRHGEIAGFTLSYGGLPTFVYTAAASARGAKPATPGVKSGDVVAYVTLVAQRLPSGDLQVALATVTDSAHLDRSPRLRLVDAVDPDDSHRASLLFELRGNTSRQFALYRLTSAQAEQTFTTASIE